MASWDANTDASLIFRLALVLNLNLVDLQVYSCTTVVLVVLRTPRRAGMMSVSDKTPEHVQYENNIVSKEILLPDLSLLKRKVPPTRQV